MTITDPPTDDPLDPPEDATTSGEPMPLPSIRQLRWPIVQALREFGGQAPTAEITEHVANAFGLTPQQRSETLPSGKGKLLNRVQWAGLELKHIGVLNYPEPGTRALTPLGLEVDDEQIRELRAQYSAEERERKREAVHPTDDSHEGEAAQELPEGRLPLTQLADELLVGLELLEDIVSLLEDKGQVILYGPPGTGKTYLARELARALAPDKACRALVQFHPSTSYEDFFEGYRPAETGVDGSIRFKLTPGPLARMAETASDAEDRQHVMIIDEINRGNLPRVLGELLFLLEYRDEEVETLYRPEEEPFSLPDNLWFIGTMNTADRSIALVDAALRRRFHFVPFFPDSGPMAGLLSRWLEREGEPAWVGYLVDAVNGELKAELGGSHLLLGPSHFMKTYGSSLSEHRQRLRRIWEYNIEPFIEDQFFGDPDQIERFRFKAVWNRHGPAAESDGDSDDPDGADDSDGEHAAADGEAAAESGSTQPENEQ